MSSTITILQTQQILNNCPQTEKIEVKSLILKEKSKKKVNWTEDTINNEGMGKKKSNICCIYHRPRLNPDDTSSDESCSSCDEKGKNAYERPNHYEKMNKKKERQGDNCNKEGCLKK